MQKTYDLYDEKLGIRWDPTLTSQERCAVLLECARTYPQVRNFIETGTAGGETLRYVYDHFDHLYTIEIVPSLHRGTRDAMAQDYPNVQFFLGDSTDQLPEILKLTDGPSVFWLDGHYCGSLEARGPIDTPICNELEIIMETGLPHIIVVDDARLFGRDPAYPTIEWIRNCVTSGDVPYEFLYADDMMRAIPKEYLEAK